MTETPPETEPSDDGPGSFAFDPALLIDVAAEYLLGEEPSLTQAQVAEQAGVDLETAWALWRYLGFAPLDDDRPAFTQADVEAVRITQRLTELQILDPEVVPQFVRAMGRTFARLADWQTRLLLTSLTDATNGEPPLEVLTEVIPMVQEVQGYIWRRHLMDRASRLVMQTSSDTTTAPTVVGFVDIVGYTSQSRRLEPRDLAEMVEWFERVTTELVLDHGGQVIKTIGDEVLYTVDEPLAAARLALALVERHDTDERFPDVRVGTAYGPVIARLGDIFGATVNLASRLTSISRPGRVLMDTELAQLVRGHDSEFRVRRTRRTSVKGYEHLEPWALKRPKVRSSSHDRRDRHDEDDHPDEDDD